ncbi:Phosphoenolpyruvate/pyruvate domain-containing protein, partial [Glonium stellatum]
MAAPIIRRALLYVPGSSKKMLDKSRTLNVDCVAYDLEDSVTPEKKDEARQNLRHLLEQPRAPGIREQAVRINSVESGLALKDLQEVLKAPNLDAIVLPKCNSASDLHFLTDVLRQALPARHPSSPSPSP